MKRSLSDILGVRSPIDVVDIGANPIDGPPPYEALRASGLARVVGFEPNPQALAALRANPAPGETYLPYAIADGRAHRLHFCEAPGMTSLLEPNHELLAFFHGFPEWGRVVRVERIETRRLDDVTELSGMDYLKIDVQGAELMVLEGAVEWLRQCLVVHIEVEFLPMYKGQPLFAEIEQFLRRQGFVPHKLAPTSRTIAPLIAGNDIGANVGQIFWADVTFIRDFTRLSLLTVEQLLKLAIMLHDVYNSVDMALRLLTEADARSSGGYAARFAEAYRAG